MQWVLASESPRRQALLRLLGQPFKIHPPRIEERLPEFTPRPAQLAKRLARAKAEAVAPAYTDALIIAADTVVVLENRVLGKPETADDARQMLRLLAGKTHGVITALCLLLRQQGRTTHMTLDAPRTRVTFRPLSEAWIEWYIDTGEPFDKAGAYGIQEYGALLVERVVGDYFNVVGLPLPTLVRRLEELTGWRPEQPPEVPVNH
ncbi:MAG: Maf family protein [Fimbriimonadales bacterium]|nr:Maf family protein [Fimbriimonadales bacterium]